MPKLHPPARQEREFTVLSARIPAHLAERLHACIDAVNDALGPDSPKLTVSEAIRQLIESLPEVKR